MQRHKAVRRHSDWSPGTEDGSEVCILPSGEEVNFYQVIPLYRDELEYKLAHDADALLGK